MGEYKSANNYLSIIYSSQRTEGSGGKGLQAGGSQRLLEVVDDVAGVFQADAQAHEVGVDAGFVELGIGELAVGVGGRVQDAGVAVGDVGLDGDQLQGVHEADCGVAAAFEAERHHAAGAVRHVFLREGVVGIGREAGVLDPFHGRMSVEEFRDLPGALADVLHADGEGLDAEVQVEGVLRALDGTEVAHQLAGGLGDVGQLAEFLRIRQAVVGLVRGRQAGEFLRVRLPIEVAAVDDGAADRGAVAVEVLGGGVGDDVGAPLDRAEVHRRREGVVHDEGHAVLVGDARHALDVEHAHAGVGERLAEEELGVGPEGRLDLLVGGVLVNEGDLDAHLREGDAEEVVGAAVDRRGGDHVVAGLADVEAGEEVGRLAGGGQHPRHAAFERRQTRRYPVVGRVLEASVEVAGRFEVEEAAHLVGGGVFEGRTLDDRHLPRFAVGGLIAGLDAEGGGVKLLFHFA